ncbi:MAG: site-specific integrase, partial [SAR324 cluster bacterium]|nr:site-specific integrase [SAR324 cluster bacterium]
KRLKENNSRIRVLSDEEREKLFDETIKDPELHDIVILALSTGARRGELEKLKWSDLDRKNQTLSFKQTKNGSERIIPIADHLMDLLRNRFLKRKLGLGDWIFPAPKSTGHADFGKRFREAVKNTEIQNFRFSKFQIFKISKTSKFQNFKIFKKSRFQYIYIYIYIYTKTP